MRIAVVSSFSHSVGGVETYLESLMPKLVEGGHTVGFWHEHEAPSGSRSIVPAGVPTGHIGESANELAAAIQKMRHWCPHVIFLQGLTSVARELPLLDVAPLVTFLHAYNGTCISGTKTHAFPHAHACSRPLGPACLVHYFPRRCGGWSPLTLVSAYREQRTRQHLLQGSVAVATLSDHMRRECIAQGIDPARVIHLPAFVPMSGPSAAPAPATDGATGDHHDGLHIGFVGRFEQLKGPALLLDAVEKLKARLLRPLRVTLVGDGRERARCERKASAIEGPDLEIRMPSWLAPADVRELFATLDLLVVPSIWPEPLGLVGLEAAAAGVPAVAFDVGGIREWLSDDVTGRLIREAPSAEALAQAIAESLADPSRLARWGAAAREHSRARTVDRHVQELELLLARAAATSRVASTLPAAAHA